MCKSSGSIYRSVFHERLFMKKLFFVLAGCISCTQIQAQITSGLRVAYNHANAANPAENIRLASLNRFQFGVFGKFSMYKNFFLKGSLIYNQKGNFYDDNNMIADAGKRVTVKLDYIEASVDIGYAVRLTGKHHIHLAAGPYLAYGINGTEKGNGETLMGPIVINRKVAFTNSKYYDGTKLQIKPIDAGLNFNVGYQFRKYGLFFNYGLGLTNRDIWSKSFNRVASVGVSYNFK